MDPQREQANLQTARRFVRLLERFAEPSLVAELVDPNVTREEFPNLLFPKGARRDWNAMLTGMSRGKSILASQQYDIRNEIVAGEQVVLEFTWQGTLSIDAGPLKRGQTLITHGAIFFQFKDSKIIAVRNYDCYEPFSA